jgi:hypothetical protein
MIESPLIIKGGFYAIVTQNRKNSVCKVGFPWCRVLDFIGLLWKSIVIIK